MTAIPEAPGPDYVFNVPPGWNAPPGFDPRRGHLIDPAWPQAPDGWQFWAPAPAVPPAQRFGSGLKRIGVLRPLLGGLLLLFLVLRLLGVLGGDPATGVGSCWTAASEGTRSEAVDCSDSSAAYKVTAETADPDQCPTTSDSYLDTEEKGDSKYKCLEPFTP